MTARVGRTIRRATTACSSGSMAMFSTTTASTPATSRLLSSRRISRMLAGPNRRWSWSLPSGLKTTGRSPVTRPTTLDPEARRPVWISRTRLVFPRPPKTRMRCPTAPRSRFARRSDTAPRASHDSQRADSSAKFIHTLPSPRLAGAHPAGRTGTPRCRQTGDHPGPERCEDRWPVYRSHRCTTPRAEVRR